MKPPTREEYQQEPLTADEVRYFLEQIDKWAKIFTPLAMVEIQMTEGHLLLYEEIEIGPDLWVHEELYETTIIRAFNIGHWVTIHNYPHEPDDVDFCQGKTAWFKDDVIPEVCRMMMQAYMPESIPHIFELPPDAVVVHKEKHGLKYYN